MCTSEAQGGNLPSRSVIHWFFPPTSSEGFHLKDKWEGWIIFLHLRALFLLPKSLKAKVALKSEREKVDRDRERERGGWRHREGGRDKDTDRKRPIRCNNALSTAADSIWKENLTKDLKSPFQMPLYNHETHYVLVLLDYVFMPAWMNMHPVYAGAQKVSSEPLQLELQFIVSHLMWVLGTD